ncbi:MAG: proprotein convertase P-domain-containing protein [Isosphaeraceae bacterium]|nr:proprotein convertase P-domain-containing protein [Isosphaeraceae bacterium]
MSARKLRLRRTALEALEGLEERTLLSALPAATPGTAVDISNQQGNESSPQIVVDRYDPNKLVAVWVLNNPAVSGTQKVFVEGAFSNDGGQIWSSFSSVGLSAAAPTLIDPNSVTTNEQPFVQVTDPSVGFDANNQFYVLVDEHAVDNLDNTGPASGALLLTKFDFSGSAPTQLQFVNPYTGNQQSYNVVYEWSNALNTTDTVARPTMAVDDNQPTFQDPTTKAIQTDPYSGNVYVSWAEDSAPYTKPVNFNPYTVRLATSADGGQTFTSATILNDNNYFGGTGQQQVSSPQIAVSQGRLPDPAAYGASDPGVPGGLVTVVYDDFNSLATQNPSLDQIWTNSITGSGSANLFVGTSGVIQKAIVGSPADIPQTTSFTDNVTITSPTFSLSDLSVSMTLTDPNGNSELSAVLIAPNGTRITLFLNQINSAGAVIVPNGNRGLTGNNLGIAQSGADIPTIFDDNAARTINDRTAGGPYIGTFRPELGSLTNSFFGLSGAQLSGTWTLQITNQRDDGTNPNPVLQNWGLTFTSGQVTSGDVPAATTSVRGNFDSNFALSVPSSPTGVGPTPVITSDNTLGSFSPHEGTLYIAYVTHDNSVPAANNPATNTDIALITSTDGGESWQVGSLKVNDDNGLTDGFSGAVSSTDSLNNTSIVRGQAQYTPEASVDQSTGMLVLSWRDSRYDASNARVATFVTTSIDGGRTFSPDVYVNAPETVTDAITGKAVVQGPTPDNESAAAGALIDTTFGYGSKMGIAVFDGHIYTIWSGNENVVRPGNIDTDIWFNTLTTSSGPRIISSTMGPVGGANDTLNTQTAADGTPNPTTIEVTFDRPVDPAADPNQTFLPGVVEVFYNGTVAGSSPVPLLVTAVAPIKTAGDPNNDGHFGYTHWLITFDATQTLGVTGTSSGGNTSTTLNDATQNWTTNQFQGRTLVITGGKGAGEELPITSNSATQLTLSGNWTITPDQTSTYAISVPRATPIDYTGTYSYLIKPVVSDRVRSYQLQNVTEPVIVQSSADVPLRLPTAGTGGSGTGSDYTDSLITLSGHPNQVITGVTVNLSLVHTSDSDLWITLISPNGTKVTLYRNPFDTGQNFTNTTFSDAASQSILQGTAPYTGTFQPGDAEFSSSTLLASMNGGVVDGTWILQISDNVPGNIGQLNNWTLTVHSTAPATSPVLSTGNMMDQNANAVTDEDATQAPVTGLTPGDVYAVPTPDSTVPTTYNLTPGSATPFPQGPYNTNTLPLIVSGPHVVSTNVGTPVAAGTPGPQGTSDNLVLNSTVSSINVTFDRDMNPNSATPSVEAIAVVAGGSGYTTAPTVSFTGGGGSGAAGVATISNGVVTAVTLTAGGSGYTSVPTVVLSGGGGTGALATAQISSVVTEVMGPAGRIDGPQTYSNQGIKSVSVTNGGSGYTTAPTVTITGGGGSGAAAYATISGGLVTSITLTSAGSGYTSTPTVTLTGGGGTGARAAALFQTIPTTGQTFSSTITLPSDFNTFTIAHLAVALNIVDTSNAPLTATLIGPDGTRVVLFSGLKGANLTSTVFDETALLAITGGTAPYTGTFQTTSNASNGGLNVFTGQDLAHGSNHSTTNAASGAWTLQITGNTQGNPASLVSWSLIATPQITVKPLYDGATPGTTRTFVVSFPQQQLSGTYTVEMAPTITSATGDAVDSNQNAGVDVLFGQGTNNPTTPLVYNANNLPQSIPSAKTVGTTTTPGTLTSTINVPTSFPVQGIINGQSGLKVQLNITDASDPSLQVTLVYHLGQADQVSVPLFLNVGSGPNAANFTNTIFDDQSPTPIQSGGAPFFGTYSPQYPLLSSSLAGPGFAGLNAQGAWSLVIKNSKATTGGSSPTLNSWSLTFLKPLPVSGLGEPNSDNISASFRIFTMDPTNALSSDTWTAVGPAGINDPTTGGPSTTVTESGAIPLTDAGDVTAIATDPSDPSGNTVYIGAASGGVWKTTDFLNPSGPTWIPLTDFGPTFSLNIGSIAIYPRNGDPNQSIIFASTGDGNTGSQGVGILRSMDGGQTWTLLDSTDNVVSSTGPVNTSPANMLPINSPLRNHIFVGTTSFKIIVDPKPTPNGGVIVYAALSGNSGSSNNEGGIWRSEDSGNTWQLMRAGQATDVVLDPASGLGGPNGNLQIVYAAFAGDGVYISPNEGQVWNEMLGQTGNPLIINNASQNVNPINRPTPNGALNGIRYVLAKPALTGNPDQDQMYEGWLYVAAVNSSNVLQGVYVTKDYGENWTQVQIPGFVTSGNYTLAVPSNSGGANYPVAGGNTGPGAGSFDISLSLDPTNPNIVYLGGTQFNQTTGLIRIDTTLIADAHNAVPFETDLNDGGALTVTSYTAGGLAPLTVLDPKQSTGLESTVPFPNAYINLIRDPSSPFLANSTLFLYNGAKFTNSGTQVKWIPFDLGGSDVQTITTEVDPLTGNTRLIIGDSQGVFTGVDNNGVLETSVGTVSLPSGDRNGNLQIAQFYYGASQPSNIAAQAAAALLYGSSNDNGSPQSNPGVLSNGNITWTAQNPLGAFQSEVGFVSTPLGYDLGATGVGTDQQGGTTNPLTGQPEQASVSQFWWPGQGGGYTDFFQVSLSGGTSIGRTYNLLQSANGLPTPDSQWPLEPGSNFAINPIDGQQMMVSASGNNNGVGRIFATENQGITWQEIGNPSALDNTYAPALAYGAPDPNSPAGVGNLDNFLYAGTDGGHIFMSETGGGANGNAWYNISTGLDGSPVEQVITNPTRGSHQAYAVTQQGVYSIADSVALANAITANAKAAAAGTAAPFTQAQLNALGWQLITGNLFQLISNSFDNTNLAADSLQPVATPDKIDFFSQLPIVAQQLGGLTSIVADWRYAIPADPTKPVSATNPVHPVLYVSGGTGVYQSLDNGVTWELYPSQGTNNAPQDGGLLPHTQISQISLVLGNIDSNTGQAVQKPGDPNILLATTYGRGDYAIRVGPAITPTSVTLDTTLPAPGGSVAGVASNGDPLVTTTQPVLDGFSEESANGNQVRITLYDLTDPNNPVYVGGYDGTPGDATDIAANQTNAFGQFSVSVNAGAFTTNGVKTIGIQATDASGTKGNMVNFTFVLQAQNLGQPQPPAAPTLALLASDDSSHGQNITNVTQPHLVGVTGTNVTVQLLDASGNVVPIIDTNPSSPTYGQTVQSITSNAVTGAFSLEPATALTGNPATLYKFRAQASNNFGSSLSPFVIFTVKISGPTSNTFKGLSTATDTGVVGDNVTTLRNPVFVGTTDPGSLVNLINASTGVVLATVTADTSGNYALQLPQGLSNGTISLETQAYDVANNFGQPSPPIQVTITSTAGQYSADVLADPTNPNSPYVSEANLALFQRTSATQITWLINKGVTTASGVAFGQGALDVPFTGDFNGDGIADLAYYEPSDSTWTIELSQGTTVASGNIKTIHLNANANAIPIVGDFDGDGVTDVGVYEPGTGSSPSTWIIDESTGGLQTFTFGQAGDQPVPGNYDGTGKDELAVYRPSTGQFLIAGAGGTANPTIVAIGAPNEVPVPGNYDNQYYFNNHVAERTDVAVYNPSTGAYTIGQWVGTGVTVTPRTDTGPSSDLFQAGDIPVPADYDGTGNAEPAVYRQSTGQFIVDGATGVVSFGTAGTAEVPVLAPYVYRQVPVATVAPTIALAPADDSGVPGDNITNVNRPHLIGKASPNVLINLINTATGVVIGTGSADENGNYSVQPTNALADGTYKLETQARGLGNGPSFVSSILTLTIQTSLVVTSTTPASGTLVTSLPNGQITVTFNHTIAGLVPNSPTLGFASNPFAVMLVPSGPDGGTQLANGQPLWSAPSGVDGGDLPVPATLVYQANSNGTSQITLTPAFPLATDIYLISIGGSGMTDLAGNPVSGTGGQKGMVYASFDFHASSPSSSALQVVGVTANHGSTVINNNQIPQPDTIAIQFNKPLDTWTVNASTVHLMARSGSTYVPVPSAVAYSPSTNTIYLTPEAVLSPGTVYAISVDPSVSDDQNFPNPGVTLGQTFTTSFTVSNGPVTGQSPLTVTGTSPANGTQWTSSLGYVSATFSEAVNLSSLGRFSAMLVPHTGGVTTGNSGYADIPMNAKVAFNPNTNQLVIVPTQLLGNNIYLISLHDITASNGDTLSGGPVYSTFQLTGGATASVAHNVVKASQSAADVAVTATAGTSTTATIPTTATVSTTTVSQGSTPAVAPTRPVRPAQRGEVHDQALTGSSFNIRSFLSSRRKALASALDHVTSERKHGSHS